MTVERTAAVFLADPGSAAAVCCPSNSGITLEEADASVPPDACILGHAEGSEGMFGMVRVVAVQ